MAVKQDPLSSYNAYLASGAKGPFTTAAVMAPKDVPPFLRQVNRYNYLMEYIGYYVASMTNKSTGMILIGLGILVAQVEPLLSLPFFALAGRQIHLSGENISNVNNAGRTLVMAK